ncbi:MAG: cupin domain-containing protein [Spirochaetes bacterium]|nr:cupin domain-containing protein [Spirochaetota bacterium]MBN2769469.1 cupin domain-containing protein [Spirochaetota bacterium]
MVIRKVDDVPVMDTAHNVDARNIYNTGNAMVTVIRLKPGQSLKKHITPVDVAFFVISGAGVVEIGEERAAVSKDSLVESPKDIVHCWYNESSEDLVFMVIKAPRPEKKTVFVS